MCKDKEEMEYEEQIKNIRAEDVLEFIYELTTEWEKEKDPIDIIRTDIRLMISFFKEEKFGKLQEKFRVPSFLDKFGDSTQTGS